MAERAIPPKGIDSKVGRLDSAGQGKLDRVVAFGQPIWQPLFDEADAKVPTPQALAYDSAADLLLYGGAAGGGKTDLEIGLALTRHRRSIIYRRTFKQLVAIEERVAEILRSRKGYDKTGKVWKLPGGGRRLEFGACRHAGDEIAYQGRPHDLKCFDEVTHFLEHQFRFLCGWLRSARPGQRQRIVATGNPPTTGEGEWVIGFWAPWLDDQHPHPALPGELRWFAVLGGEEREVESGQPFEWKRELIQPRSRSFIPSRVEDNPYLMKTGYRATLQALPEPLRSQLLKGAFDAGREADPWQVVPTDWVKAAQARWRSRPKPKTPMDTIGVDPARGGRDETVLSPRHGGWFAEQAVRPGSETPDGPTVAALVVSILRGGALANVDVIGIGAAVYDHLKGNGISVKAMNGAEASQARDRSGSLGFVNKRAEWWWRMREALDPDYGEEIAMPPDRKLLVDLCTPKWRLAARGIQVESKEEIVKRIARSPDRGDAAVYALAADPPKRGRGQRPSRADGSYSPHGW